MLHTLWTAFAAIFVTIPSASAVILLGMIRSNHPWIDRVIHFWARSIVRAAGIDLQTKNLQRIDPKQRYIFVANHYSYFDIPCILTALGGHSVRFMAKVSLFRIPIFGWSLSRAGFIPIDRNNRRTAVKSFDLAAKRIQAGNTIVIFPEEGRTKYRWMRPFQRGAFLLAIKSEQPIVPLAVDGTYDVFRVGARSVTPGRVTVRVGEIIATANCSVRDKERLLTEARGQIESMLWPDGNVPQPPPES
jgi:1-acyl-sn-glycerol-3-phosphate acyltransferase